LQILNYNNRPIKLDRFPLRTKETLRAWDAADEYILDYCLENDLLNADRRILIVNDGFGALGTALAEYEPVSWGDSYLARQALEHNLELNNSGADKIMFIPADMAPEEKFNLILLKLPKSMVWWEDILLRLRPHIEEDAVIVSGGMIKHSPATAYTLAEKCIGPTKTSLGRKKARLAFSTYNPELNCPLQVSGNDYMVDGLNYTIHNRPNVFGYSRPDAGTGFLLANLPQHTQAIRAADLGSGNGVLTLGLLDKCPGAEVLAVDESYQALACTKENVETAGFGSREVTFLAGDCLAAEPPHSFDLIVCNPPFHQKQVIGDHIAWRMFQQAHRALKSGGEFYIVSNRHLGYHVKLKRLFGNCEITASNSKFVVLKARLVLKGEL